MNYVAAMTIGFILCAVALCVFLVFDGEEDC